MTDEKFAAVVEEGSFDAAAARLHVTPSAVSQRIKALEQRAGQVLVVREKPCSSTAAGVPLLRLAAQTMLERIGGTVGPAVTRKLEPTLMVRRSSGPAA